MEKLPVPSPGFHPDFVAKSLLPGLAIPSLLLPPVFTSPLSRSPSPLSTGCERSQRLFFSTDASSCPLCSSFLPSETLRNVELFLGLFESTSSPACDTSLETPLCAAAVGVTLRLLYPEFLPDFDIEERVPRRTPERDRRRSVRDSGSWPFGTRSS